jgi:hypothetical protein
MLEELAARLHRADHPGRHPGSSEDTDGTDVIAPEWDWRRDLG